MNQREKRITTYIGGTLVMGFFAFYYYEGYFV